MKKKYSVFFVLLAFIMTITCLCGASKSKALADSSINVSGKAAYLIEPMTNTVIFASNEEERLPIASMCKIMTLLLCFEAVDNNEITLTDSVTVSETAAGMGGSQVFLEANGEYTVETLLKSIVVASANDACVAMAEKLVGSENLFVEKMNDKAKELGMNNTVFVNCTGLPKPSQYSCAKDVAVMLGELLKHKDYYRFSRIWIDEVEHNNNRKTQISNTNKLIRFYEGCDGGKTGYTSEAGHCLAASAFRNGMRLISVVIAAPDSKTRFKDVSEMFNYGFSNYVNKKIVDDKTPLDLEVEVSGGKKDSLQVVAERPVFLFSLKTEKRSVELDFVPESKIKAPVTKGIIVGVLNIYENDTLIDTVNVLANEDVLAKTYFDVILDIGVNWSIVN